MSASRDIMTASSARGDEGVALGIDIETLEFLLERSSSDVVPLTTSTGRQVYFVNDPVEIHRILVRNHDRYVKGRDFQRVKMLLGNGLFVSDGATWRRSRTMVQPGFKARNLDKLIATIVECCRRRAEQWHETANDGRSINITKQMTDYALEVILRATFGGDYESGIITDGQNPFRFLSEDPSRDLRLVLKLRALRKLVLSVVEERRRSGQDGRDDFLSLYMSAKDKGGQGYSDDELLDEIMTLIVAGFETSAGTLNWAWYLIAGHPEVDAKIVAEARRVIPDGGCVDGRRVSDLPYLGQVLNETMRLYPPGWIFSRRAVCEDRIGAYDVPVGADVYISPYILHRSEQYWSEPHRFDPDRFAAAVRDGRAQPAAFIPFSLGSRRCIGEHFAMLEMKIVIALLLQRFRLERTTTSHPGLALGINLRSRNDIHLRATHRSQAFGRHDHEAAPPRRSREPKQGKMTGHL